MKGKCIFRINLFQQIWSELENREDYITRSFVIYIILGDHIKKNDMGGMCGTMREESGKYRVLVETLGWKRQPGKPRLRWMIILRRIFRKWDGGMDWTDLVQNRERWLILVNMVMKLRVPKHEKFLRTC